MIKKSKSIELLAPAGDYDALVAAVLGGADAVYLAGECFGARAYAKNFTEDEIASAVKYCHLFGVRIYVAVNTLITDKEMETAVEYAKRISKMGVDALIVADLGLVKRLAAEAPEIELHASTQMGIHNTEGANLAYSLGISRVVLARECSGKDIEKITAECLPEVEVFCHGALCVCHSGQCLFSSMVGGRSGNRGECAQPCRLPYNGGKYPLSLRDLSLAEHITELIAYGVSSLKIEGRMKSPSYVYEVTSIYRKLLDEKRNATAEEKKRLRDVFSRGGFTDGYFTGKISRDMTGIRTEDDKKASRELENKSLLAKKMPLHATASITEGKESRLAFTASVYSGVDGISRDISFEAVGAIPNTALSSPLSPESVSSRLAKLGNTPFSLGTESLNLELSDGLNLAPSSLNALRRDAADGLLSLLARPLDDVLEIKRAPKGDISALEYEEPLGGKITTALFLNTGSLSELLEKRPDELSDIDVLFVGLDGIESVSGESGAVNGVYIPPVIMESEWDDVCGKLRSLEGIKYALVGNLSHLSLARDLGMIPIADIRMNITNRYAKELLVSLGVKRAILSAELTLPMIRDIGGGAVVLGRIPLMLTERCFIKENFGCDKCGKAELADRVGARFPMLRESCHRNLIMNSAPTYMGDKKRELERASVSIEHFIFSSESSAKIAEMLKLYKKGAPFSGAHRRLGKREVKS